MKTSDKFTYTSKYATYENCMFCVNKYVHTKNLALSIYSEEEGPITTCTINTDHVSKGDEIGVKNYSENEGMVDFLKNIGIIEGEPVHVQNSGWVEIPYYKLSESGKELFNELV
jgi:hypothetical protein